MSSRIFDENCQDDQETKTLSEHLDLKFFWSQKVKKNQMCSLWSVWTNAIK